MRCVCCEIDHCGGRRRDEPRGWVPIWGYEKFDFCGVVLGTSGYDTTNTPSSSGALSQFCSIILIAAILLEAPTCFASFFRA